MAFNITFEFTERDGHGSSDKRVDQSASKLLELSNISCMNDYILSNAWWILYSFDKVTYNNEIVMNQPAIWQFVQWDILMAELLRCWLSDQLVGFFLHSKLSGVVGAEMLQD